MTLPDLGELYQGVILDHNRSPRNFRALPDASGEAEGNNPLCGDRFRVWVKVEDGRIAEASFLGEGCAISKAAGSIMTTEIKGKTEIEARDLFERFHRMVTEGGGKGPISDLPPKLGVFKGVGAFPMRVKCATLAWHAMREALDNTPSGGA